MNPTPLVWLTLGASASAAAAFALGSIPFGYVVGRLFYRTDIRASGSGNIGAMNALRTLGKGGAVAVLLLDAAKGLLPVAFVLVAVHGSVAIGSSSIVVALNQAAASMVGAFAVLGHCFSPWLRWKGGKGVATAFGALFALCWPVGIAAVLGWVAGALLTRYSSVGSMLGTLISPFALFFFTRSLPETLFGAFAAAFIVWTHRENLARLRAGTEGAIPLLHRR
jgi:glycerol-3-phosphate acyltransferase PlsY